MSFQLTERIIKQLCGSRSYDLGADYYKQGKVKLVDADPDTDFFEAKVRGTSTYDVTVEIDPVGDVDAECTCPAYDNYDHYCEHIAAVLLAVLKERQGHSPVISFPSLLHAHGSASSGALTHRKETAPVRSSGISNGDRLLAGSLLKLFDTQSARPVGAMSLFETREPLQVEFICRPYRLGNRNHLMGIEMRAGTKRMYIVQNIRDFLEQMDHGESHDVSRHFTYDPEKHFLSQANEAVVRQLIRMYRSERTYRDMSRSFAFYGGTSVSGDKAILVPPFLWDSFLPLLAHAPSVTIEHERGTYEGIAVSEDALPLQFNFDEAEANEDGYQLDVEGLESLIVLEDYGMVLFEGALLKLSRESCICLSEFKRMIESARKSKIRIPAEQMEPFLERVIPGLMQIGSVQLAQSVSDRIVHTPLQAKLYLDRVRDRLLAGLEFQYGDIVVNPLEASGKRGESRILMRDGEGERRILALMERTGFAKTEAGYFLEGEDEEYEFLYHVVPQLEKLLKVYATTAVKIRLYKESSRPTVKVDVDERTDWLEFKFDVAGIPEAEIRGVLQSLEEKRKYYRLPSGALMPLEGAEFQELIRFMNEVGIRRNDLKGSGDIRLPAVRGLTLMDAELQGSDAVKLGKKLRRLLDDMRNPDNLDFPVPERLDPVLRDYQKYGFQWLKTLAHYRFGGILADDMGLGKTLQSIAFLVSVLPEIREEGRPALVVCPASLVYNWRNELKRFAPDVRAVIADGSKPERSSVLRKAGTGVVDVVITSYPLLRRDIELYGGQSFHTLLLDEAQAFKNHATQTAQAVKAIAARYRFALTGTPVENSLEELWSIFDAVFPELFPSRKAFGELSRETVARRVRPFLLRRLKRDVLQELPEKIESLQASELLPDQKKLYVAYLAKLQQETLKHLDQNDFQKNRIKILAGLTRLRQICCHPALFVEDYAGSSSKFEQLQEILEECRSAGKRVLLFSQFTQMLGIIGRELGVQGVPFFYLDGQTPGAERVELCRRFNEGEKEVFLISLKAGGTGLNLTGADTVILYDLWWNPAVEQQAADRAHRIGQKNVVQVIRLVAQGTVEDKMYALQQRKLNLIEEVIQPGQEQLSALTEQEIREILSI